MATKESTETNKPLIPPSDWLKWLGERRDGFLIGGAVLYGLGYLVWSYNAWRNHLGQLPAIEFQYLVSGLMPGAILGITWSAIIFSSKMRMKTQFAFDKKPRLRWLSFAIILVLQLTISIAILATDKGWVSLGFTKEQLTNYTAPLLMAGLYFLLLMTVGPQRRSTLRSMEWMISLQKYFIAGAFGWYSLVIYLDLYPHLPQELGGPQPRCAYIDLVREDIAPSTLAVLVPSLPADGGTVSKDKVVRSNKLNVYFSSSDYLLVRAASDTRDDSSAGLKRTPLYELRKEVIRVVEWCPE